MKIYVLIADILTLAIVTLVDMRTRALMNGARMNRHRANWSLMGIEPSTEQSQISKDYEKLRSDLNLMVNRFGFDEVVKELRKVKENDLHS